MKTSFLPILAAVLLTALCSGNAFADGTININSPTNEPGNGWTFSSPTLTITTNGTYTFTGSGSTTNRIKVSSGVTADITLSGVIIFIINSEGSCAFDMTGATVNLTLTGNNTLQSGSKRAALEASNGATLTITEESTGSLAATGGTYSAGIGGGDNGAGGNITISGGTVTATGADYGAGIGGGYNGAGGNITISGGTVTATGADYGAGIGGGYNGAGGNITINGGTITATGGDQGAGIGGGRSKNVNGTVTITGGSIKMTGNAGPQPKKDTTTPVYLNTLTIGDPSIGDDLALTASNISGDASYGLTDVKTRDGSKVYFYLPETAVVELVRLTAATKNYKKSYKRENNNNNSAILDLEHDLVVTGVNSDNSAYVAWVGDVLTFKQAGDYTVSMATAGSTTTERIQVVADGSSTYNITLNGVSIDVSAIYGACAFDMTGATVDITLTGNNTLKSGDYRAGLQAPDGATLEITAVSTGSLTATGGTYGAGIGGGEGGEGGDITINGGTVTAYGGDSGGAGIGGGSGGAGGTITIHGGTVTATGSSSAAGAGIGGGEGGEGGDITISGGTVTANGGGMYGAGIGGGEFGAGGTIAITGGTVTAIGGSYGAGIGGGNESAGGDITISGGTVTATGGATYGTGIGGGASGTGGSITISGGTVTANGGTDGTGIGGGTGYNNTGSVTISGGSVKMNNHNGPQPTNGAANVYLNTLTLASMPIADIPVTAGNINFVACNPTPNAEDGVYGIKDVKTGAEGKVYFYLPVAATAQPATLIAGSNYHSAAYSHSATDHSDAATLTVKLYDLTLNHTGTYTFIPAATYGYATAPAAITVKALNTGNTAATFNIALSGTNPSSFTLSTASTGSVNPTDMGTFTIAPKTGLDAGTHTATVTVSIDGQGNSYDKTFDVSFEVEKKDPTAAHLDYDLTGVTYDGNQHGIATPTLKTAYSNIGAITVKYDGSTTVPTDAKTYAVTVSVDGTGSNFNATVADLSLGTFTIAKADLVAATHLDFALTGATYDGMQHGIAPPTLKTAYSNIGVITVMYDGSTTVPTVAKTYAVTASVDGTGSNFNATVADLTLGDFTIGKKNVAITGGTVESKMYDGTTAATVIALTFDGLENNESLAIGTDYTVSATFDHAGAGAGKTVTATAVLTITTKANNYSLTNGTDYAGLTGTVKFLVVYDYQYDGLQTSVVQEDIGLLDEPPVPTREGYTFGDWYKESSCTNEWNFAADEANVGTTLYAKWLIHVFAELKDGDGNPVTSSEARVLFYRTDAGEVEAYAADWVGAGNYRAALPAGSYIVAAENAPAGYLTTYYDAATNSVTRWHDATALTIADGNGGSTIIIRMAAVPQDIETGSVTIDGYVYEDGTQKARVARNASVGIYYSKKSGGAAKRFEPDPQEWTLIRTVTPDENAYYIVQNLPPGRYMIVADIPGYELSGGYTLEAEEGEALHDNNFFVNDYAQVITISDNPTSAPLQENETWAVYPNPSQGETHVSGAAGGTLTVFTATGATVHTRKITAQDETVSLKSLPSGLYFFRITDKNGKTRTMKIINN